MYFSGLQGVWPQSIRGVTACGTSCSLIVAYCCRTGLASKEDSSDLPSCNKSLDICARAVVLHARSIAKLPLWHVALAYSRKQTLWSSGVSAVGFQRSLRSWHAASPRRQVLLPWTYHALVCEVVHDRPVGPYCPLIRLRHRVFGFVSRWPRRREVSLCYSARLPAGAHYL